MAVQHVCDRCGKVIRDFETNKNTILIFDKNVEPNITISHCGVGYMNKVKYAELCEDCQNILHAMCKTFMEGSATIMIEHTNKCEVF